jgi:hypothetical protein
MFSNPDSFNFLGGLNRSVGDSFIYGTLGTTNAALSITGAVTVVGNSTINAGTGGSSAITLGAVQISTNTTFTVGVGDSGNVSLVSAAPVLGATATRLRLGSSGTTTVSSTITGLSVLQVDRGDATFTGNVGISGTPIASVILSAVSGATIFTGDFYATSVTGSGGAGSISFLGSTTSVTNAAAFAIGGTLTLGNGGDSLTFTNGITATSATIDGTLTTVSSPISINSLTSTTAVLTTGSTSSSTVTLGSVSGTTTITGGAVSITGTASGAGTLTINTSGNVTFSRALNMTGGLVVSATAATVSIPGGSVGSVAVTATTINLTTAPLFVTGATSLSGSSAVTLQSGSGINNSSSGNAGTITISAGAGGFSQAANAGIFTRNNTASAIGLTVTGGGSASIGQLVAVQADNTTAATVTINVAGALSDINDGSSGPATNNVRAGTFTVTGNPVGSVTNPIEYYSSNQLTSANNFWVVSTAPSSASGFLRRFDFTRVSTAVMAGTTGVFASNVYSATTASSTSGTHFGFTSGQSIAIVQGTTTSLSSYNLYIDSLVQTTRVATFHIDTNAANTTHTIRVYFGSATYATNTIVTLPGDTAALATANVALRSVTTTTFTATSDSAGTVSFEFKRPAAVTTGYWGVYGVDIAANAGDLPTAFPQMLADVTFDESGLTEETQSAIGANGRRGQILDESAVLAVRDEAIAAWAATGLSPEQMQILLGSPVVIGDLSADGQLGLARADHIVLDDDAMGLGWFVGKAGEEVPAGTIDLLTVMTHEFGHRLGYDDLDTASNPGHIMAGSLQPGERRSVTTERPAALRQPAVAATEEIAVPAQSETADLFATAQSPDATVTNRISPLELVQNAPRPSTSAEANRRTLKVNSPGWPTGPASTSENSAGGPSLLDDLFADVITALDLLN